MAKNRGGLGRGLGALMGDPAPHSIQTPSYANQGTKPVPSQSAESDPNRAVPSSEEAAADATEKQKLDQIKEAQRRAAEARAAAKVEEAIDDPAQAVADVHEQLDEAAVEAETEEEAVKEAHEEDHVVIEGVAERPASQAPIDQVYPNPEQPRTHFKQEELEELADSIKRNGLLQPILVRQRPDGYQIIAGERRWQASRLAGLTEVPIKVLDADDDKVIELAMIENIQRSDLNAIEEAYGYRRLMERKGLTQSQLAQLVSKGRSTIANSLRLLELPEDAQQLLFEEKITAGHARAILSIPTAEGRQKLTEKLMEGTLTVRQAEAYAKQIIGRQNQEPAPRTQMPREYKAAAKSLSAALDTKVRVKTAKGKNKLEIEFTDQEQLDRIMQIIGTPMPAES